MASVVILCGKDKHMPACENMRVSIDFHLDSAIAAIY